MERLVKVLAALSALPLLVGAAAVPEDQQRVAFEFADAAIAESSALVPLADHRFATVNDSGDSGRVFVVDGSTGRTAGVTHWAADPVDVEALASCGPGTVWVGDIGDNRSARSSVEVAEVPVGTGERSLTPASYELVYPDGAHDAETLVCHPRTGRLYVGTKGFFGGALYELPRRLDADRPNRLRRVATIGPLATDGAFLPDGRHLLVRGYASATVYAWPSMEPLDRLDLPAQPQGEGLGIAADGTVYVSTEGVGSAVLTVPLPEDLRRRLDPAPEAAAPAQVPAADTPAARTEEAGHDLWPWALGGAVGLLVLGALWRSRRPR